jgi:SAM-dependent methyltransferase
MAGRRHPGLVTEAADVRRLPFDDDSFNTVVSISTLDHFEQREEISVALRELARVLRPGGQLLLTMDNLAQPAVWLRSILPQSLMMRLGLIPYAVGKTLGPRRLQAACRDAGLQVEEATAVLHCPRALAVACTRWLERHATPRTQDRFLAWLSSFECLERLPTRYFTGYFVALRASKPE